MLAVELIKGILIAIAGYGILGAIVWCTVEKKWNANSLLILSAIALIIMFNI